MTKDFRIKTKDKIKLLVKEKDLKLFRMRIYIGECTGDDVIQTCNFLLNMWHKMMKNHLNIFFKWFLGFTRELIVEIDGETCRPYLLLLLFADRNEAPKLAKLQSWALAAWLRISMVEGFDVTKDIIPLEEIPVSQYDSVIDDLMLPCIRIITHNPDLEEKLFVWQYDKQLCSRGGLISRKNLERNVALDGRVFN